MRSDLQESFIRGSLRVFGTICVAVAAYCAFLAIGYHVPALGAGLASVGGITLYCALTRHRSYAWFLTGLTFSTVIIDAFSHPLTHVMHFAEARVVEVISGTAARLMVSGDVAACVAFLVSQEYVSVSRLCMAVEVTRGRHIKMALDDSPMLATSSRWSS